MAAANPTPFKSATTKNAEFKTEVILFTLRNIKNILYRIKLFITFSIYNTPSACYQSSLFIISYNKKTFCLMKLLMESHV